MLQKTALHESRKADAGHIHLWRLVVASMKPMTTKCRLLRIIGAVGVAAQEHKGKLMGGKTVN